MYGLNSEKEEPSNYTMGKTQSTAQNSNMYCIDMLNEKKSNKYISEFYSQQMRTVKSMFDI